MEALAERLEEIGLDAREARVYARLAVQGPLRASEVARLARLHRTEAYRVLESLMTRGCVVARLEKPTLYEAVAVEKVFEDAAESHHARARSLAQSRVAALSALERLKSEATGRTSGPSYRVLQGRDAIYATAEAMVRRARESQHMVSTHLSPSNATHANRPLTTTIERAKDGLPMRFMLRQTPGLVDSLAPLLNEPRVAVRWVAIPSSLRFTLIDDREILYWLASDPAHTPNARGDVALWTDAPEFVAAQRVLYDALWERSAQA